MVDVKLLSKKIKANKYLIAFSTFLFIVFFIVILLYRVSGFSDGYNGLPLEFKSKVRNLPDDNIYDLQYNGFVFRVSAKDILSLIEQDEYSLVYIWHPNCPHDTLSLEYLTNSCASMNLRLYIVSDSYEYLFQYYSEPIKGNHRLFVIDSGYYNTKIRYLYSKRFLKELINKTDYSSFLLFKNGKFIRDFNEISELYLIYSKLNFSNRYHKIRHSLEVKI